MKRPWLLPTALCALACSQGELVASSPAARDTADTVGTADPGTGGAAADAPSPDDPTGPGAGGGAETPDDPDEPERPGIPPPVFEPTEPVMPRLTAAQYRNTLEDLFGDHLPRTPVEPDTNPYLFYSIGAATTEVSERGVEQYGEAALLLSAAVFADPARRARVLTCEPAAPDDACADAFVRGLGRRLYRRPLAEDEVQDWLAVSRDTAQGEVLRGLETVLAGLLQAPSFLYRAEVGDGERYDSWEMAARLAFLLTNAGPDEALLDAAARGELQDEASLETQARRLLATPRARGAVQDFFAQYLDLKRLDQVDLDPAVYPGFGPGLMRAMDTEVRLLVDDVVFRRPGDVRQLFSRRRGYVNDALASLYGVQAAGAGPNAFVPVDFPADVPRAGVLTLGAFLTMNAHRADTSPTLRGKYIRERVLCEEVPPPPDNVDLDLEAQEGDPPTLRERLEQHRRNPACAGCHSFIDPPGFLFEHYDSMGRYRETANGFPVDSSGDLDGEPLSDALALAEHLRDEPAVGECIARQLYRHASGRLDNRGDRAALKGLYATFETSGYDFRELLVALVKSEGFRRVAPPSEEVAP